MTHVQLYIAGKWTDSADGKTLQFRNPATNEAIGTVSRAGRADLEKAVAAAEKGFAEWRRVPAFERSKILRKAADNLRARADDIGRLITLEQGKVLAEGKGEAMSGADIIDWFAEEARRTYGRVIPARAADVMQTVVMEPIGPVAAFSPWNFPVNQAIRKLSAALATGCSVILKGPEETPASCAALVQAFVDAGVPDGAVALLFGVPSEISEYLIAHPVIRKVSFTGSTQVGKLLAEAAGRHMKRITMELGGHAPTLIYDDADLDKAAQRLAAFKYRNGGQVCGAPTRFLVQDGVYDDFLERFTRIVRSIKVGNGLDEGVQMGALANPRRVDAISAYVEDAADRGATVAAGGNRIGNIGNFFEPTVLTDVPLDARIMNEEPFGPVALIGRFSDPAQALAEANRLPYGLASYVYTSSAERARAASAAIEAGMVSINHCGLGLPETPFGGVKDSGFGSEGGTEAVEPYLIGKFVTHALN